MTMRGTLVFATLAMALAACNQQPAGEPVIRTEIGEPGELVEPEVIPRAAEVEDLAVPAPAVDSSCTSVRFEDVPLTHCVADPDNHTIRTALAPVRGQPYGSLSALAEAFDPQQVAFAVNAGAYGDNLRPLGYYVEDSERLAELSRGDGQGNFFLRPNGVFFGSDGAWRILTTEQFYSTVSDRPQFGTQSGPMLVIDGELHPEIAENGPSRAIRNGVGLDSGGKAHFVKSEEPLSFGQLARFYRDELGVANALFLNSNVSVLWDPANDRLDRRGNLGPFLVVEIK